MNELNGGIQLRNLCAAKGCEANDDDMEQSIFKRWNGMDWNGMVIVETY